MNPLKLKNTGLVVIFSLLIFCFSFPICAESNENLDNEYFYLVEKYAPNFWFDSEEQYYLCDYSDFYYDENFNEISGNLAKEKYDKLSLEQKLEKFKVFYKISDISENEIVIQYWLFYVFNNFSNQHYGDGESVFIFIDKNSEKINRIITSAHLGNEVKVFLANNELAEPKFNNVDILVEKGSHANYVDGNKNGVADRFFDLTNWYNAYGIWGWSLKDKEGGIKINHSDQRYKLEKLSYLENKLKGKEKLTKSESLGALPINFSNKIFFVSQILEPIGLSGGKASDLSEVKLVSENPEIVRPITAEFVLEKSVPVSNFLVSTINNIGTKVSEGLASGLNSLPNLFSSQTSSQTGEKVVAESAVVWLNPATAEITPVSSVVGKQAEQQENSQKNEEKQITKEELVIFEQQINEIKVQIEIEEKRVEDIKQAKKQQEIESQNVEKLDEKQNTTIETTIIQTNNFSTSFSIPGPSVANNQEESEQEPEETPEENNPIPETTIESGPTGITEIATAIFSFSSSLEQATFECKLDENIWEQCASPKNLSNLGIGNHTFQIRAKNAQGDYDQTPASRQWEIVAPPVPNVPEENEPPSVPIFETINAVQNSLSFTLSWQQENQEQIDHYKLQYKKENEEWLDLGNLQTNTYLFGPGLDEKTYKFRVKAINSNKESEWYSELEIKISLAKNIVVNEIAWMGTKANSFDEWIELYNNTAIEIDLTNWILKTNDESPNIIFPENTKIAAQSYFLLERTDNNTISDVSANFIYTGALNNSPECEVLYLYNSGNQLIDKTFCLENGDWPAGQNSPNKISMERINSQSQGDDASNWQSNKILVKNGKDKNNNVIYGTPKQANSHLTQNVSLENLPFSDFDEIVLYKENSPFFTINDLVVPANKKLTIKPGSVLKINKAKIITIQGTILAQGTSSEKIIFTSSYDSDYGGAGISGFTNHWRQMTLNNNTSNTKFENCIFKYGGKNDGQGYNVVVYVNGGNPEFKNLKFSNFATTAAKLENSSAIIENSEFYGAGPIWIISGNPTIKGNYFEGGSVAIDIKDSTALIENNTIKNFTYSYGAIKVENGYPRTINNTFENNSKNGIFVLGTAVNNWKLEPAIYLFSTFTISNNSIFEISPGAILKFFKITIYSNPPNIKITGGSFKAGDLSGEQVVFTSVFDDYYGGDTNNDGSSTIPNRDSWGVGETWDNGNWNAVELNNTTDSFFKNIVVSCGGKSGAGAVALKNSNVIFDDINFEYNFSGLYLDSSTATISNSKFEKSGKSYYCIDKKILIWK